MTHRPGMLLVGTYLLSGLTHGAQPTLSQQLLDAYFKTAGVCSTSQVQTIEDAEDVVTITIAIEPQTLDTLLNLAKPDRNNWFSLHCPPEIHGVWHQENPPADIQVQGQIEENQLYSLSCVQYQQDQWNQTTRRPSSIKDRITTWLEDRLK
ncbi:hypothetical protein IMCC3135_04630 [Granulosicoccus antarcticus IMCC3135]|uniref:Uncharacterized protein n=2 Tax=Granulosicoccus TaxID=437504 RepID=A0A2Z2NIR1_9GAMM|nr:hypothetical protein IMCC3135_04630 [Granulosicoccus antarcticus IMCC3135]